MFFNQTIFVFYIWFVVKFKWFWTRTTITAYWVSVDEAHQNALFTGNSIYFLLCPKLASNISKAIGRCLLPLHHRRKLRFSTECIWIIFNFHFHRLCFFNFLFNFFKLARIKTDLSWFILVIPDLFFLNTAKHFLFFYKFIYYRNVKWFFLTNN